MEARSSKSLLTVMMLSEVSAEDPSCLCLASSGCWQSLAHSNLCLCHHMVWEGCGSLFLLIWTTVILNLGSPLTQYKLILT